MLRSVLYRLLSLLRPSVSAERTNKSGDWMSEQVASFCNSVDHSVDWNRLPLDGEYWVTDQESMREIIEADLTDAHGYQSGKFDCENYALSFAARVQREYGITGVGIVIDWSGAHAYNMLVTKDSVELYEPQNDELIDPGQGDMYPFENVSIII